MCLCIFLSVTVGTNIKDFWSLQVFTNIFQLNFIFWAAKPGANWKCLVSGKFESYLAF